MKNIQEYINEQLLVEGSWSFNRSERDAFIVVVGYLTGNYGYEDDFEQFASFKNTLTDDEIKKFNEIFDILDDEYTYKKVGSRVFKEDLPLLKKFAEWIDDNDITREGNSFNWDLMDAIEKILG